MARGTRADGAVIPGLALGILTTRSLTRGPTIKIETGPVQRTLAVIDTLSWTWNLEETLYFFVFLTPSASDERVSPVSRGTSAHGSVGARSVKPGLALSPGAAGVGVAQVLLLKGPAADEGVPGVALGAAAHRLVVGGLAGGPLSAHVGVGLVARVAALEPHTSLVSGTVCVSGALGVAPGVGVAQEVRGAGALGPVVNRLAVSILSTSASAAGIFTPGEIKASW